MYNTIYIALCILSSFSHYDADADNIPVSNKWLGYKRKLEILDTIVLSVARAICI